MRSADTLRSDAKRLRGSALGHMVEGLAGHDQEALAQARLDVLPPVPPDRKAAAAFRAVGGEGGDDGFSTGSEALQQRPAVGGVVCLFGQGVERLSRRW